MSKFRKRPVVIEAVRWNGAFLNEPCPDWLFEAQKGGAVKQNGDGLLIFTLEGVMEAAPGDYIIQGVKGEIYPCKPDIFEATYEQVFEEGGPRLADLTAADMQVLSSPDERRTNTEERLSSPG